MKINRKITRQINVSAREVYELLAAKHDLPLPKETTMIRFDMGNTLVRDDIELEVLEGWEQVL